MPYLLPCECGQKLTVSAGQAGQEVTCACGRVRKVPILRELRQLPQATEAKSQTAAVTERRWGLFDVVMFAGLLLTVGSLVGAGVLALGRSTLDIQWTEEWQAEADAEVISQLNIDQVLGAWVDLRNEGLGGQNPHKHMFDKSDAETLTRWIRRLLIIAMPSAGVTLGAATALWLGRASRRSASTPR